MAIMLLPSTSPSTGKRMHQATSFFWQLAECERPNISGVKNFRPNLLSRAAAIPLAPVLLVQARMARASIPRLPDAALPWTGSLPGAELIRLLVLGDSTAAGVGADSQSEALPGSFAREFGDRFDRGTTWQAIGENGATARDILTRFIDEATTNRYDVVFLTIGANDALGLRSRRAFARDVREIVHRLRSANPDALLLVSLMPRFDRFRSLKGPLRWNLALHAASLDDAARAAVRGLDKVFALPKPPPYTPTFWSPDLFHPGPAGYREWAEFVLDSVPLSLLAPLRRQYSRRG
jgi:lysophospholipase L1-like esterase